MHLESLAIDVEFDAYWYDQVFAGVAYFFRWLGEPRQTVLAIWDAEVLTHVECRLLGDIAATASESREAIEAVRKAFRSAGFVVGQLEAIET